VAGASDVTSVPGGAARIHQDIKGEAELLTRFCKVPGRQRKLKEVPSHILPIEREKGKIIDTIENNQVTIISGPTGCGKTTRVPQFILEHAEASHKPVNIIVTQPRKIAASAVATRVCQENNWELGTLVGYKVGLDKENVSRDTRLLFCTTGMFKKMVIGRKSIAEWTHVVLDEVHEREIDLDFVLMLCKKLGRENSRGVKLILMSATLDLHKFERYFQYDLPNGMKGGPGQVEIMERYNFDVQDYFMDTLNLSALPTQEQIPEFGFDEPELKDFCINKLAEICHELPSMDININNQILKQRRRTRPHTTDDEMSMLSQSISDMASSVGGGDQGDVGGAVLVFLPGENEISRVKNFLEKKAREFGQEWWILPLHSKIPQEELRQAFVKPSPGTRTRKIILATNIAESSITIPDITYVIDFCLTKKMNKNLETNYMSLRLEWADKNSCKQRKGRCGRVGPGRYMKLVPQAFFNKLKQEAEPEMLRSPLEKLLLDTKLLDFGSPKKVLAFAMSPPKEDAIEHAFMELKEAGAVLPTVEGTPQRYDGDLTVLGEIVAHLPLGIRYGKLVVFGHLFGVLEECVIIAAGISNKSIFASPFGRKVEAYSNKLFWANNQFSDCLATLFAYNTWKRCCSGDEIPKRASKEHWCNKRHLQLSQLEDMDRTILEIYEGLKNVGIEPTVLPNDPKRAHRGLSKLVDTSDEDFNKIKFAIFGAFYPNYFLRNFRDLDSHQIKKDLNGYDPMTSVVLNIKEFPREQDEAYPIYEEQIKKWAVSKGLTKDKCRVHFDGRKAVITFARGDVNNTTILSSLDFNMNSFASGLPDNMDILHDVYVAMKLKSLPKEDLKLKIWNDEKVYKMMRWMRNKHQESGETLTSWRSIGQVAPPIKNVNNFKVVYSGSPNAFWVVMPGEDDAIQDVVEAAERYRKYEFRRFKKASELKVGIVTFATFEGSWYRAKLEKVEIDPSGQLVRAVVWFIDYGNTEVITDIDNIRQMDLQLIKEFEKLIAVPGQAMACTLTSVAPNPMRNTEAGPAGGRETGGWDEYACQVFEKLLDGIKTSPQDDIIQAEIYSVTKASWSDELNIMSLTVHDEARRFHGETLNAQMLRAVDQRDRRLAKAKQEDLASQDNHELRRRGGYDAGIRNRSSLRDTFTMTEEMTHHLEKGMRNEKFATCAMSGPHHPLEYRVAGVHRQGSQLQTRVEPDSVNSVLLDRVPNDRWDQWMVAASVSQGQKSECLVLRSTTFMPISGGLGALLAMVFAPRVELRCDKQFRNYTGCLIGLGDRESGWGTYVNSKERCPYYALHDTEIKFDFELTDNDVNQINKARHAISKALMRECSTKKMSDTQKRAEVPPNITIRDKLLDCREELEAACHQLVQAQQRVHKEKVPFGRELHWKGIPERRFVPITLSGSQHHIFPSVSKINLSGSHDFMLRQLDSLKDLAVKPNYTEAMIAERKPTCPICGTGDQVVLTSKSAISDHIYKNPGHKENLRALLTEVKRQNETRSGR